MKRFQFLICLGIFVSNLKCLFITNFPFHSVHICIDSAIAPLSLKFIIKFDCNITHQLLSNLIFVFDDALFNGFIFKIITVKQKIKMYNPTKGSFFDKVIHQKNSFCLSGLKKWNQFSNSNHVFYVNLRRKTHLAELFLLSLYDDNDNIQRHREIVQNSVKTYVKFYSKNIYSTSTCINVLQRTQKFN